MYTIVSLSQALLFTENDKKLQVEMENSMTILQMEIVSAWWESWLSPIVVLQNKNDLFAQWKLIAWLRPTVLTAGKAAKIPNAIDLFRYAICGHMPFVEFLCSYTFVQRRKIIKLNRNGYALQFKWKWKAKLEKVNTIGLKTQCMFASNSHVLANAARKKNSSNISFAQCKQTK